MSVPGVPSSWDCVDSLTLSDSSPSISTLAAHAPEFGQKTVTHSNYSSTSPPILCLFCSSYINIAITAAAAF